MDAIILVGGQGTRLRPLTLHRHKSLVPVGNRPAIRYLFDWLGRNGVERVVLALGRDNDDLAEAFPPGSVPGVEIVPVFEHVRLESGGAIRNAVAEVGINDRFVVLNGDVYVDFDLGDALGAHTAARADLTLALSEVENPSQFGVAVTDSENRVTGFVEKPPRATAPSKRINAGVWIFERAIVDQIPEGAVRVEETLFPSLVARGRGVLGYDIVGPWADIGTPERYLDLNVELAGRPDSPVAPSADVNGADVFGLSFAGEGSELSDGCCIRESVLWENVSIGKGANVSRSILADGVKIGEGAVVERLVAGRGAVVPAGAIVPAGTVLQPDSHYDPSHD